MKVNKSVSKSIRMTEEVFNYIDGYAGEGFNEKFANIILDAQRSEAARRARLAELDNLLEQRRQDFATLNKRYNQLYGFFSWHLDAVCKEIKAISSAKDSPK